MSCVSCKHDVSMEHGAWSSSMHLAFSCIIVHPDLMRAWEHESMMRDVNESTRNKIESMVPMEHENMLRRGWDHDSVSAWQHNRRMTVWKHDSSMTAWEMSPDTDSMMEPMEPMHHPASISSISSLSSTTTTTTKHLDWLVIISAPPVLVSSSP